MDELNSVETKATRKILFSEKRGKLKTSGAEKVEHMSCVVMFCKNKCYKRDLHETWKSCRLFIAHRPSA